MARGRFGRRVARWRERAGLTQEELGDRIGLSRSAVSKIERDLRGLSLDTALRLAATLGVSVESLMTDAPPQEATETAEDNHPGVSGGATGQALLMELARAVSASARAMEKRISEVEAVEARALEKAQDNIERMMAYLPAPAPHSAGRRDEEAARDA